MLRYKIDIINALKEKGVTSHSCKTTNILGQSTFTALRKNVMIRPQSIDTICSILRCQPGDIIEWVPDKNTDEKNEMEEN